MSKPILIILGLIITLMGVLSVIPSIDLGDEPNWHGILKIVVGVLVIILAAADKGPKRPMHQA